MKSFINFALKNSPRSNFIMQMNFLKECV
uniref:Uncharacterized protein n=1 Tax=Rhizophora mucronata TaxID=61149 RepID=A0A2P2PBG1_RHIMU